MKLICLLLLLGCGADPKVRSTDELPPIYVTPKEKTTFVRVKDCVYAQDQADDSRYPEMICVLIKKLD